MQEGRPDHTISIACEMICLGPLPCLRVPCKGDGGLSGGPYYTWTTLELIYILSCYGMFRAGLRLQDYIVDGMEMC